MKILLEKIKKLEQLEKLANEAEARYAANSVIHAITPLRNYNILFVASARNGE